LAQALSPYTQLTSSFGPFAPAGKSQRKREISEREDVERKRGKRRRRNT
jgi:hypothetical protein